MTSCGTANGFVGGEFADLPTISVFGAFARVVRLNHIRASGYFSAFGLRTQRSIDLSSLLTFPGKSRDSVVRALGISLPASVHFAEWMPFTCSEQLLQRHWTFRFCPACLKSGFHTLLQQLPWIDKCPWHGIRLRERCPICGSHVVVSTGHGRLLECDHGHDLVDETGCCANYFDRTDAAATFQKTYLTWAAQRRAVQHLLAPETADAKLASVVGIIALPSSLRGMCHLDHDVLRAGPHSQRLEQGTGRVVDIRDQPSAFAKLAVLRQRNGAITVPSQMAGRLVAVSRDIVNLLPPGTLSEREASLFLCGSGSTSICHKPFASRAAIAEIIFLAPLCIGNQRMLDVSMISKVTIATILRLIEIYHNRTLDDQGDSDRLLIRVASCILARAYAEGLRVVLARHFPVLFDLERTRPHISDPWVLVETNAGQILRALVAWVGRSELP